MKKKFFVTFKDNEDWKLFTKNMHNISAKDSDLYKHDIKKNNIQKLDLHGFSLLEANKIVKQFIIKSFNNGYKKLLIVTGKGSRSKSFNNPYISQKLSVLKHSIPEYIMKDESLNKKIKKISQAEKKYGGDGAIYIFLKSNDKFTK